MNASSSSSRPGAMRRDASPSPSIARGGLGYNGGLHESGASWQFLGNGYRVYSAVLRRFHSLDSMSPFGEGGINPYAYCGCDPINNVDPSGHFLLPVAALLGLGSLGVLGAAGATALSGKKEAATILLAVGGALLMGALVAAGEYAVRPSRRGVRISNSLGRGGVNIWRGAELDVVRVHGNKFVSGWGKTPMNGVELANAIKSAGSGGLKPKPVVLQSCYGGFGGNASQGQVVADTLGVEVTSYLGTTAGRPGLRELTAQSTAVVFTPQTGAAKEASRIRNEKMNRRLHPRRHSRRQRLQVDP